MKAVVRVLTSGWFLSLIGVVLLSLVVWFLGPLIAIGETRPFEDWVMRTVVILVLFIIWGVAVVISLLLARRSNDRMIEDIAQSAASDPAAADEEVALVRERLVQALSVLKKSKLGGKGGRQWLYQLPWYVIIGPPGAGKTTALINSGLDFPLAEKFGKDGLKGVGGTRNCDWWFTNEAVLIDTAGRYTTQDSQQTVDQGAWQGFLKLLRRYRPRQPINGAIVCISIADIGLLSETERMAHARAIRSRLKELTGELGVRFPVYVSFTKTDLIAGFIEFFDDLGREDREQVWGMTLPLDEGKDQEGVVGHFGEEFDLLVDRLNQRAIERLQQETDVQRRSQIYAFPAQFASLKPALTDFVEEIFRPSRFEERPLLRGIYFSSGTQEGTPFDRLMSAMSRTFGLDRQQMPAFSGKGRSYFLTDLLRRVAFAEASVVSINRKVERRRLWLQRAAYTVAALVLLGTGGVWAWSYFGNVGLIERVEAGVARYNDQVREIAGRPVEDSNLLTVLPALEQLRGLEVGYTRRDQPVPMELGFGLYQGDKLGYQAEVAYRRALNSMMLPRLLVRLEEQLQASLSQAGSGQLGDTLSKSEFTYLALKAYLLLGGQAPMEPEFVRDWMARDWSVQYPGPGNQTVRDALTLHLAALVESEVSPIPLNGPLVEQSRVFLAQFPLAERAYARIVQSPAAKALPEWTVVDKAGPAAARVLTRPSGKPLSEGVPGIYTYDGFHRVFLPSVETVARDTASEAWVLGQSASDATMGDQEVASLMRDILDLYYDDYAVRWDTILADVRIVPFQSLTHAVEVLNIVSGPRSPLVDFLKSVSKETLLSVPPPSEAAAAAAAAEATAAAAGDQAAAQAQAQLGTAGRLAAIFADAFQSGTAGTGTAATPPDAPGKFIDDRFQRLHEYVEGIDGQPPPLNDTLRMLNDLYLQLNSMAMSPNQTGPAVNAAVAGLAQQLSAAAGRLPEPMGSFAAGVAEGASTVTVGGARQTLNAGWNTEVQQLCQRAIGDRYPFYAGSSTDVTLDDFASLFAPGGRIDGFFKQNLAQFVDTSQQTWRWQRVNNVDIGIPDSVLIEFQRAAKIRDAFWPAGGGGPPNVGFELLPVALSATATRVTVEINGQSATYDHGPPRATPMRWPGPGPNAARVSFTGLNGSQGGALNADGPWAFFHLLQKASVQTSSLTDRFNVTFSAGGNTATFEVRAGSVLNPFSLAELKQFRCPEAF